MTDIASLAPRPTWRVMVQRNYAPYFFGNLISNSGTWIQLIAQALLIFRLTGSTFFVALVTFAQFIGVVVLAPWTGAAADRYDRKRLLAVTQVVSAAATAVLAIATAIDWINVPLILGIAFIVGVAKAFAVPALHALVPGLVEPRDLQPAIALNAITFNLARALGPVVGALVIATLGFTAAFALNAASYMALVAGLALVTVHGAAPRPEERPKLASTVRLVRADPRLVALLWSVAAVAVSIDPVQNLTPAFAVDVYLRPDTFAGLMVGAFGAGAVIAAVMVSRVPASRVSVATAMVGVGLGLIVLALLVSPVVGLGSLFVAGAAFLIAVIVATTIIQRIAAEEHRGRIMALWSVAYFGFRPIAALVDGAVATLAGVRVAALVMALPALIGGLLLLFHRWSGEAFGPSPADSEVVDRAGL